MRKQSMLDHFGNSGTILFKSGQGLTLSTAGLVCTKKTIIFVLLQLGEKFDESTPDGREVSKM